MSVLGIGKHSDNLERSAVVEAFKYVYVAEILYNISTLTVKFAFTREHSWAPRSTTTNHTKVFYLRILREPVLYGRSVKYLRNSRVLLWTLAVFITCFATAYGFILIFQCLPVSHAWTQFAGSEGHCMSPKTLEIGAYLHSAINGTLDLLLAFLPVPFFWKMELRWRMKLSVIGVLCIGALYVYLNSFTKITLTLLSRASVATFIRFKYINRVPGARFPDPTCKYFLSISGYLTDGLPASFLPLALWSVVEPGIALFAGGLVVSKPLFNTISRLIKRNQSQSDSSLHISVHVEKVDKVEYSHTHEPTGHPGSSICNSNSSSAC